MHLVTLKILSPLFLPVLKILDLYRDSRYRYSLFPPAPCFDSYVWWCSLAWVLPAAGRCQEAGSPSAEMQGIIIQMKAPHLGSLSSYGRKEVKITAEVTVFHKSESDLFCFTDFTLKEKKKERKNSRFSSGIRAVMIRLDLGITIIERISVTEANV